MARRQSRSRRLLQRWASLAETAVWLALTGLAAMAVVGLSRDLDDAEPLSIAGPGITANELVTLRANAKLWEDRAATCADLLSAETGAGYDVARGDIERAAASATEWAAHVSELEDTFGD